MTEQRVQIEDLLQQSAFLRRLAYSLVRDDGKADDLVQDVWLAAVKNPPRPGNERAWLGKVLKHRNLDRLRSTHVDQRLDQEDEREVTETPQDVAESLEAQSFLMAAIEELKEPHRSLVVARYFMGQTPREIAENRRIPGATVRSQLTRALEMLRKQLDMKMNGDRRSWALLLLPMALHDANLVGAPAILAKAQAGFKSLLTSLQNNVATAISILLAASVALFIYASESGDEQELSSLSSHESSAVQDPRPNSGQQPVNNRPLEDRTKEIKATAHHGPQIRVLNPNRTPLFNARVVLYEDDNILGYGSTKIDGYLRPEGISHERTQYSYAILTPEWPVKVGTIDLEQGNEIVFEEGKELSGVVAIEGDVNFRSLKLFYLQRASLNPKLPKLVKAKLWNKRREERRLFCHVAPDGTFRFQGLPANSRGQFILAPGFGFDDGTAKFRRRRKVRELTTKSKLKVVALSQFTGKVIASKNGAPIAGQLLSLKTFNEDGLLREQPTAITNSKGEFVLSVEYAHFKEAQVFLLRGGTTIALPRQGYFRDTIHLGDIPVPALVAWPYQVFGANDEPIINPKIAVGTHVLRSKRQNGKGFVATLDPSVSEVFVGAKGYQAKRVPVHNLGSEPQRITLEKTNALRISADFSGGLKMSQIRIRGDHDLLPKDYHKQLIGRLYGLRSLYLDATFTDEGTQITLKYRPGKQVTLPNFTPNASFTVEGLDAHGQVLAQLTDIALAAQETRALTLSFDANRYKITDLTVTDGAGEMLKQFQVEETGRHSQGRNILRSDECHLHLVRQRSSKGTGVIIKRNGYLPRELTEAELIHGPLQIKLVKE